MFFADLHCDTLSLLNDSNFFDKDSINNVSYDKLVAGNVKLQTFAVCVPYNGIESSYNRGMKLISDYKKITSNSCLTPITDRRTLSLIENSCKIGTVLALEGCDMLNGNIENLCKVYDMGVRILSLTWNNTNSFSGGIGENNLGLTEKGVMLLKKCEKIGVLIDVSHISEKGFWDIADMASKPFVATHSNVRAICNNKRNLDNKQLYAIKKSGGCVGINFYPPFLNNCGVAAVDDIIAHIEYMAGYIGTRYIAFGSDFDGVDNNLPDEIHSPRDFYKIYERLLQLNYTQNETDDICQRNFIRVFSSILK